MADDIFKGALVTTETPGDDVFRGALVHTTPVNDDIFRGRLIATAPDGDTFVGQIMHFEEHADDVFRGARAQWNQTWALWSAGLTAAQVLDVDFANTDRTFQTVTGTTLADDAGESIALALDSGSWGGRSLADEVAAQDELRATGAIGLVGTAAAATYDTSTGEGQVTRVAFPGDQSYVSFPTVAGAYYELDVVSAVNNSISIRQGSTSGTIALSTSNVRTKYRFAATGSGIYFTASSNATFTFTVHSLKLIPGNHGVQATGTSQPARQAGGVSRYDGSADNLLTGFLAQSGAMTVVYHGTVPASLGALQVLMGSSGASANRCWLGVTTGGLLAGGVGSESEGTIVGTTDVRGKEIVAALTFDGSTATLMLLVDGAVSTEYSGAQASTPTTAVPFRLGAMNNNGTAGSFAAIDANSFKAAHKAMTLSEFRAVAARMME